MIVSIDWTDHATCQVENVPVEVFFPSQGEDTRPAKDVCGRCPVIGPCLDHALRIPERFGIWGGKSERERRRMRVAARHAAKGAA